MPLKPHKDGVTVQVRLTPGARQPSVTGLMDVGEGKTALKVGVNAVPEDGKANQALLALLATTWGLPKSSFTLISGTTNRQKVILVSGDTALLTEKISGWIKHNIL